MSPGPAAEVGKVATGFVDAMKSQPLALALAVMNLALLGLVFFIAYSAHANHESEMKAQSELQQLLAQCHAPADK
jgi:hypothetical protein